MPFDLNEFKAQLVGGGARPSLFSCILTAPPAIGDFGGGETKFQFMAKTAQIPQKTFGVIEVPYFGRKVKLAGDPTFPEFQTTIINDEDFAVHKLIENWMAKIRQHVSNKQETGSSNPREYFGEMEVIHYGKNGEEIRRYKFVDVFPSDITPIELGWETTDQIEEFQVTWNYSWWESDSTDGTGGGAGTSSTTSQG